MSAPDRRAMVERRGMDLSLRRQCALLNLARSGVYRPKPVVGAGDLALMRRIDELHLELPFFGSRRMTFELNKEGRGVNRKRVQRLSPMRSPAAYEIVSATRLRKPATASKKRTISSGPRTGGSFSGSRPLTIRSIASFCPSVDLKCRLNFLTA
jgi:putative transposase